MNTPEPCDSCKYCKYDALEKDDPNASAYCIVDDDGLPKPLWGNDWCYWYEREGDD